MDIELLVVAGIVLLALAREAVIQYRRTEWAKPADYVDPYESLLASAMYAINRELDEVLPRSDGRPWDLWDRGPLPVPIARQYYESLSRLPLHGTLDTELRLLHDCIVDAEAYQDRRKRRESRPLWQRVRHIIAELL